MKTLIGSGLLAASLTALAVPAQAQVRWTGGTLTVTGNQQDGCNLTVTKAEH